MAQDMRTAAALSRAELIAAGTAQTAANAEQGMANNDQAVAATLRAKAEQDRPPRQRM